jgi:hypothetical protein
VITHITKRTILGIVAFLGLILVVTFTIQQTKADADQVFEVSAEWDTPHTQISNSENGARKPVISASRISNRVLVVYDHWTGNDALTDKDPYYSLSTNGGTTWSTGQPIKQTANGSNQTVGILDNQDTAFAIWVESNPNVFSTLTYAQMPANGSWTPPASIFLTVPFAEGQIFDPYVTVDADNTLHVVWSQLKYAPSYGINIYYSSKPQGGSWRTPVQIKNTAPPSREPAISVDSNKNLHIVWEESTINGTEIRYSSGTISSDSFVAGSADYVKLSPDTMDEAVLPLVNVSDGKMQVVYTNILSQSAQNVYFGSCTLPCTGFDPGDFNSITGFVSVNGNNPFNLVADLDYSTEKKASFVYFHGAENTNAYEAVMGRSSCSGWIGAVQDNVTDPSDYRAIEPSIAIKGDTMYLAYDRIVSGDFGFDHQIYVTKSLVDCQNLVYLPTILKK